MAWTFYRPPFISRWVARRSAGKRWLVKDSERLPPFPVLDDDGTERELGILADDEYIQRPCRCDELAQALIPLFFSGAFLAGSIVFGVMAVVFAVEDFPAWYFSVMVFAAMFSAGLAALTAFSLWISLRQLRSYIRMRRGKRPPHTVTFDRRKQTVSLPPVGEGDYIEVPWRELEVIPEYSPGSYGGHFGGISALRPDNHLSVPLGRMQEEWDFYCWYMDPRKPLPPGRVFDPYRQRDDERRAREYGPEVLHRYPSALTDGTLNGLTFWR